MEVAAVLTAVIAAALGLSLSEFCCGEELMQKEGTNSAAFTLRVENLLSMDLSWAAVVSPLSACCSHESGATVFAIFITVSAHPDNTAALYLTQNTREQL